ncbi:hypothetical protein BY458DRAFT_130860 [Sporodiniella umbellata]|nr:hypothetical protein BY458DRAFT_130860 [Sporodiniella umbellata]
MFAKSKRFPEADNDYIPGPGEYDVGIDDGSKHKRYAFINQSGRFPEDHIDDDGQSISTASSEIVSKREKPIQREFETFVAKLKRMEATIELLESEKKNLQIDKDMALADIRSKNTALQKALSRQQRQTKTNILQKKTEKLELDYKKNLADKDKEMVKLQHALEEQISRTEDLKRVYEDQIEQYSKDLLELQHQNRTLQETVDHQQSKIETYKCLQHDHVQEIKEQKSNLIELQDHLEQRDKAIEGLAQDLRFQEKTSQQQQTKVAQQERIVFGLRTQFKEYRHYMNTVACKQHDPCQIHVKELNLLLTELHQAKKFINEQAMHIYNLKSETYWVNSRCKQVEQSMMEMNQNRLEQLKLYKLCFQKDTCTYIEQPFNEAEHLQIQVNDEL